MTTTLSDGTTTVTLHSDLLWSDEHSWWPVEQTAQRTITGAMVVSSALRVAGRPITLEARDDTSAWHTRATIEQLRNWASTPGQELTLSLLGETYSVMFRHQDGAGVEASPIIDYSDPGPDDPYRLVVRLMEI